MNVEILKQKGHRFLWINDYLWMWDIPIERDLQKKIANQAYGDVLVAGYGLGIVQKYLLQNNNVSSVITVEKNPGVIDVCKEEYGKLHGQVIRADFYDYGGFEKDCVVGDIWDDIVPEHLDKYKRFKEKASKIIKPNGKILAWGKDYFEYLIEQEGN